MAFRTPRPEHRAEAARQLPLGVAHFAGRHDDVVRALLAAADDSRGPVDHDAVLAAVKHYRAHRAALRRVELDLAEVLIVGGATPGKVCARLAIGRSALQKRLRARLGDALIGPGKPPTRRAA
ncbi:hypothetical protein [Gordonia humi]|uniref:Uncharacterized protein n=1 Tax=Gordonia humi TaxID=686429 RepID=A0A840F480_9ACTN|nr:hypothetical protein [Gordonia humi]MBB4137258.1 hypothetical protein [Gordonia humi]